MLQKFIILHAWPWNFSSTAMYLYKAGAGVNLLTKQFSSLATLPPVVIPLGLVNELVGTTLTELSGTPRVLAVTWATLRGRKRNERSWQATKSILVYLCIYSLSNFNSTVHNGDWSITSEHTDQYCIVSSIPINAISHWDHGQPSLPPPVSLQ